MSFSSILIRSIGAATLGVTAYEINYKSKEHAVFETRQNTADYMSDLYVKHNAASDGHIHTEKMKEKYRDWVMDNNYVANVQYSKNRVSGVGEGLLSNIIPLALGFGALMAQSSSKVSLYKGFVPPAIAGICAVGIGFLAVANFVKNVLGFEHSEPPGFYP